MRRAVLATLLVILGCMAPAAASAADAEPEAPPPAPPPAVNQAPPAVETPPASLAPPAPATQTPPASPAPSTSATQTPPASPAPAPAQVPPKDHETILRGVITTRGDDDSRVGIGLSGEMRSPLAWGIDSGPGFELDLWQGQTSGSVISFLPVYWTLEYRPLRRFPSTYLSGRFGFDLLGQDGDDTLASRSYYALGIGLFTREDRPQKLQWEIIYSRMRGAFPGIGLSVGYRF